MVPGECEDVARGKLAVRGASRIIFREYGIVAGGLESDDIGFCRGIFLNIRVPIKVLRRNHERDANIRTLCEVNELKT